MTDNKQAARDFLNLVVARRIDEAYEKHVDPRGKHHNAYYPAGFAALKAGMVDVHTQFPNTTIDIKHALGEGDFVAVHSHVVMTPGEPGVAVIHLFRFVGGKMVEMWDVGQPVPQDTPNADGVF